MLLNKVLERDLASQELEEENIEAIDVGVGGWSGSGGGRPQGCGRRGRIHGGGGRRWWWEEGGDKVVVYKARLDLLDDIVVEATTKATVTHDDDEGNLLDEANLGERDVDVLILELLVDAVEDLDEGLTEEAIANDGLLGTTCCGTNCTDTTCQGITGEEYGSPFPGSCSQCC